MSVPSTPPSQPSPASNAADSTYMDLYELGEGIEPSTPQTFIDKFMRKAKKDPLVPIGLLVTTGALTGGVLAMTRNDSHASQRFMQLRVGAQAFTLVAVCYALYRSGGLFTKPGSSSSSSSSAAAAEPRK